MTVDIKVTWPKEDIALAISGGVDSVVLFMLLTKHYEKTYKTLTLFHVHHGLREASDEEEANLIKLAKAHHINIEIIHLDFKDDFSQQKARDMRYEFFKRTAKKLGIRHLITAHHLNDDRETMVHQLFSGRTTFFNLGIENAGEENGLTIHRPLLNTEKKALYQYAHDNKIRYFEDESNQTLDYTRNYVRHKLIPVIDDFEHLRTSGLDILKQDFNDVRSILTERAESYIHNDEVSRIKFNQLRHLEKLFTLKILTDEADLSRNRLNEIIFFIESDNAQGTYEFPNGTLTIAYDKIYMDVATQKSEWLSIESTGEYIFNGYKITVEDETLLPLTVRTKKQGDRVSLNVGTKKVSRMFIDSKVPNAERERIPVVLNEHEEIIAIGTLYNIMDRKETHRIHIERVISNDIT